MRYNHLDNLLNAAIYSMMVLFEHGFAASSAFEGDFAGFAAAFKEAGLMQASERCDRLASAISRSRFEVDAGMAEEFATLWEYIQLCIDRISYYSVVEEVDYGNS